MLERVDLDELAGPAGAGPRVIALGHPVWRGAPLDPEAFAEAWREHGSALLTEVSGGHALAVTDPGRSEVTLVRGPHHPDSEPIYVRLEGRSLVWGARLGEVAAGLSPRDFNREAVREVLNYRFCLGAAALVDGVEQTLTGRALTIRADGSSHRHPVHDIRFDPEEPQGDLTYYGDRLLEALENGLAEGLEGAERPLVLLSGGVDSALLAALGHRIRPDLVALTPTWRDHEDPEMPRARRVADHLGIEHRTLVIDDDEIPAALVAMIRGLEQPAHDIWTAAMLTTLLRLEGEFDVVISGEGADTAFGSGDDHFWRRFTSKRRFARWVPFGRALARIIDGPEGARAKLAHLLAHEPEVAARRRPRLRPHPRHRGRFGGLLDHADPQTTLIEVAWDEDHAPTDRGQRNRILTAGQMHMRQMGVMAQASGIRWLVPFLDGPATELAKRIPARFKFVDGRTKPVVRAASDRLFPAEWARLPKLGFPTPTSHWLGTVLAPWLEHRLGPESWSGRVFGDDIGRLDLERDRELMVTLASLSENAEQLGVRAVLPDRR